MDLAPPLGYNWVERMTRRIKPAEDAWEETTRSGMIVSNVRVVLYLSVVIRRAMVNSLTGPPGLGASAGAYSVIQVTSTLQIETGHTLKKDTEFSCTTVDR